MAQKTPIVLSNGKAPTDNHGSTKAAWVRQFFEQLHGQKDKHVRCMVMKPFHATRGLVQVGTVANELLMLSRCDKEYNNTSTDVWIKHVHEKHDIAIPAIQQFQGNLVQRDAAGAAGEDVEFVPYE